MSEWIFLKDAARQRGISQSHESNERTKFDASHLTFRKLVHPRTGRKMSAVLLSDYIEHVRAMDRLTPLWERNLRSVAVTVEDAP